LKINIEKYLKSFFKLTEPLEVLVTKASENDASIEIDYIDSINF